MEFLATFTSQLMSSHKCPLKSMVISFFLKFGMVKLFFKCDRIFEMIHHLLQINSCNFIKFKMLLSLLESSFNWVKQADNAGSVQ